MSQDGVFEGGINNLSVLDRPVMPWRASITWEGSFVPDMPLDGFVVLPMSVKEGELVFFQLRGGKTVKLRVHEDAKWSTYLNGWVTWYSVERDAGT